SVAALAFAACVALTLGGSEVATATAALGTALDESLAARAALARREKEAAAPPVLGWTDRLQAIAEAVPARVTLKRIGTLGEGTNAMKDQRVVIEGETEAAADYIAPVTGLIDRLTENAAFMREVKRISFDGATVASAAGRNVASF